MWIFTKDGFYSIVQHNKDAELMHVRARVLADLERLLQSLGMDTDDIDETPTVDYPYRANVPRELMIGYVVETMDDITYRTSVKTSIGRGETARQNAYADVWSTMYDLTKKLDLAESDTEADGFFDILEGGE